MAPGKAVDGNSYSYSCTHKENDNYWSVDLGMDAKIYHLYIKNTYALSGGELFLLITRMTPTHP